MYIIVKQLSNAKPTRKRHRENCQKFAVNAVPTPVRKLNIHFMSAHIASKKNINQFALLYNTSIWRILQALARTYPQRSRSSCSQQVREFFHNDQRSSRIEGHRRWHRGRRSTAWVWRDDHFCTPSCSPLQLCRRESHLCHIPSHRCTPASATMC